MSPVAGSLDQPRPGVTWARVAEIPAVTVLYVAAAVLGLQYAGPDGISPLWPSAGLAVAAVLLRGRRMLNAVALGSATANLLDGSSLPLTIWIATVSAFEAWAAAALMTRWSSGGAFRTLRDVPGFLAAAVLSTAVVAAMASVGMSLYGANTVGVALSTLFRTWWSGGLVGILVVTPLLLEWSRHRSWTTSGGRWFEMSALAATVVAIAAGALVISRNPTVPYMVFAPLAWASWRFGARGATALSVCFAGVVVQATALGLGPFANAGTGMVQAFLLFVTVTAVFLGLASQATQDALEAARESEWASQERLTQVEEIFEHSPNGLAFLDRSLTYRHVNQRFATVVGLRMTDCLGRSISHVDGLTSGPQLGRLLAKHLEKVLEGGEPIADLVYTWAGTDVDAPARVWKVGVWPHESPLGGITGVYLEAVDITDLRRAEDERWALERKLAAAREQESRALRQSDAMKTALLSSVSHELRTPLTSMRTALSGLAEASLPADLRRELSASAAADADYLTRLVGNLLDMSRLEAGTLVPDRQWHTTEELIETAVRRVGEPLSSRPVEITRSDDLPPLFIDAMQIQLALVNLLDNATKYSPAHSPIQVIVTADEQQGLILCVRSQGAALTADEEARVFERFFRASRSGPPRVRGLGLGLAIAKAAVESHGGRMWTRRDGAWTEFGFCLPAARDQKVPTLAAVTHGH